MGADSPTAARMRLGARLKSLRGAAGFSAERAAAAIGSSLTKVSRIESGQVPGRLRDVVALLDLYGISEAADRDALLDLARESGKAGYWHPFSRQLPARVRYDLSLEAAADAIAAFDPQAVPALLQTAGYARALCAMDPAATWRGGLGPQVLARRRDLMGKPTSPHLWVLISAAVLQRPPGGDTDILREQVGHLMHAADAWGASIQVVPEDAPAELITPGPFSLLRFAPPDLPDIVLLEQLTSTASVEGSTDLERYREIFEILTVSAYTPEESRQALEWARRRLG